MFKSPCSFSAGLKCFMLCCDKKQCLDLHVQSLKVLSNQIQAGLFLHQGYVPEKATQIKVMQVKTKFTFTVVVRGLTTSFYAIPQVGKRTCRIYMYYLYNVYTFLYTIHAFLYNIYLFLMK
jgi:hypothetical protein